MHAIAVGLAPRDGALRPGALAGGADVPDAARLGRAACLWHGWLPPDRRRHRHL